MVSPVAACGSTVVGGDVLVRSSIRSPELVAVGVGAAGVAEVSKPPTRATGGRCRIRDSIQCRAASAGSAPAAGRDDPGDRTTSQRSIERAERNDDGAAGAVCFQGKGFRMLDWWRSSERAFRVSGKKLARNYFLRGEKNYWRVFGG